MCVHAVREREVDFADGLRHWGFRAVRCPPPVGKGNLQLLSGREYNLQCMM